MPYTPQTWADGPGGGTPITSARLGHIEAGIAAALTKAGDTMTGSLVLPGDPGFDLEAATKHYVDTQVLTRLATAGGTLSGVTTINATGSTGALPGGYQNSANPTGLTIASSYPSDDVTGGTDGTGRLNLYSYQRAGTYSFGEIMRVFNMRKDSKQMIAWYAPTAGFDATTRDPVAGTQWKPVTWIGTHWESTGHTGNHKHWEIEIPDSSGALNGRFEVLFGNQADETIGLDKTKILTNLTDFVVRCAGTSTVTGASMYQALRLSAGAGLEKAIEFANDTDGVNKRWKVRTSSEAETGAGAGANFHVARYDDTGTLVDQPLVIARSSGIVTLMDGLSVPAGVGIGTNAPASTSLQVSRAASGTVVQATQTAAAVTSPIYTANAVDTSAKAYQAMVTGDTVARLSLGIDGKHEWGSGSATRDTNLYRSAASTLKTDGSLVVGAGLTVTGPIATTLASKTSAYTVTATDSTVLGDATTATFTVTLPTAVGCTGRQYTVKKTDASVNAVTIGTTSSQTIDGTTTKALATQYAAYTVQSDGANWQIIGKV